MADSKPTVDSLFAAAEHRISCYALSKESTISDERIHAIINFVIKHTPSSFNVQSARAIILLKDEHEALWELAAEIAKKSLPEDKSPGIAKMAQGFTNAYGSVLFLESQEDLDGLAAKNPLFGNLVPEWGDVSNGMHQYLAWTAFELEGLGCNLQHFNFMPEFSEAVSEKWKIPATWKLKSQLVFGKPVGELVRKKEKTFKPLEDRVKVYGS